MTQKLKTQTSFSFELLQAFLKKERNKLYGKKLSQFLQRTRSQLSSDYKNGSFAPPTALYIVALHYVSSSNFEFDYECHEANARRELKFANAG